MTRKEYLEKIIELIQKDQYDSSYIPINKLYEIYTNTRSEYQAPTTERDALNYGYKDIGQMGSTGENPQ